MLRCAMPYRLVKWKSSSTTYQVHLTVWPEHLTATSGQHCWSAHLRLQRYVLHFSCQLQPGGACHITITCSKHIWAICSSAADGATVIRVPTALLKPSCSVRVPADVPPAHHSSHPTLAVGDSEATSGRLGWCGQGASKASAAAAAAVNVVVARALAATAVVSVTVVAAAAALPVPVQAVC